MSTKKGHAPGHLRTAFVEFVDAWWSTDNPAPKLVEVGGEKKTLSWLLGHLWNCTDALPGQVVKDLELEGKTTYAAAVRKVAAEIRSEH